MSKTRKLNLTFLITVIVYIGGSLLYALVTGDMSVSVYIDLVVGELLIMLPAWGYIRLDHVNTYHLIGRRGIGFTSVLCLVGITFLAMPLLAFLNIISSAFAGNAVASTSELFAGGPGWLNFLLMAVMPAFCEEFVFRGVFYNGYRRHGFWKAALASGFIFGLMHLNFNQFSYGFALGVIFAAVTEATGSIHAPMFMHFLINLQSVSLINSLSDTSVQELSKQAQVQLETTSGLSYVIAAAAVIGIVAIITTTFMVLLIKFLAKQSGREDYFRWVFGGGEKRVRAKRSKEPLIDFYLIAATVICAVFMVYSLF